MGTLSFMHTFRVNELFFLGGRREGTMGSFALGETAAGRQNRVMLQTVGTCGSRLYNKETEYFFKRSLKQQEIET